MARIDAFFRLMHAQNASDLHLSAGCVPCLRIQGDLEPVKFKELGTDALFALHLVARAHDRQRGTGYLERVERFYRLCRDQDLALLHGEPEFEKLYPEKGAGS